MTVIERDDGCDCTPSRENPSVIGACACSVHGMKALIRERDDARQQLRGAVEALNEIVLQSCNSSTQPDSTLRTSLARVCATARAALGGQ